MGMIRGLSGVHNCYDNARMESFFAMLKKEKLYQITTYRLTRDEVRTVIFRYVFGYYNTILVTVFTPMGCRRWLTGRYICRRVLWLDVSC